MKSFSLGRGRIQTAAHGKSRRACHSQALKIQIRMYVRMDSNKRWSEKLKNHEKGKEKKRHLQIFGFVACTKVSNALALLKAVWRTYNLEYCFDFGDFVILMFHFHSLYTKFLGPNRAALGVGVAHMISHPIYQKRGSPPKLYCLGLQIWVRAKIVTGRIRPMRGEEDLLARFISQIFEFLVCLG